MEAESENNRHPLIDIMMDLTVALTNNNEEDALAAADRFYQSVCSSQNISSSQVRDLYFKYLVKLDEISMSNHISLWQREGLESESIWEGIMDCAALKTLHQFFCEKIKLYFSRLASNKDETLLYSRSKNISIRIMRFHLFLFRISANMYACLLPMCVPCLKMKPVRP